MCIIAVKNSGIAVPPKETLETCFEANDDGAGFMWASGGKVHWRKGLMTFDEFWGAFQAELGVLGDAALEQLPIVFHFRIGTHGDKRAATHTHPFMVTNDFRKMVELSGEAACAFMHNGILRFETAGKNKTTYGEGESAQTIDPSDTMDYVHDILWPISRVRGWYDDDAFNRLIQATSGGCRFVIMNGEGKMKLFGAFEESEGILYSNRSYIKRVVTTHTYSNMSSFDWDAWEAAHSDFGAILPSRTSKLIDFDSLQLSPSNRKHGYPGSKFSAWDTSFGFVPEDDLLCVPEGEMLYNLNGKPIAKYKPKRDGWLVYRYGSQDKIWLYEYDPLANKVWYVAEARFGKDHDIRPIKLIPETRKGWLDA